MSSMTTPVASNKGPKTNLTKNQSNVGRKKGAGTGLNDMFIAVFAVAFVLSLSLNIMHMAGLDDSNSDTSSKASKTTRITVKNQTPNDGSAVHRAMNDFISTPVKMKKPKMEPVIQNAVTSNAAAAPDDEVGEEHNTHDLPPEMLQQQQQQGEGNVSDDEDDTSHLMKLATLDCKAYGGPSLEDAQEMVYWQEIPSDSTYVSPFYKTGQQQASHTKYLTFEPDGGGW